SMRRRRRAAEQEEPLRVPARGRERGARGRRELRAAEGRDHRAGEGAMSGVDDRRESAGLITPLRAGSDPGERAERAVRMVAAVLPQRLVAVVDPQEHLHTVDEAIAAARE